MDRPSRCIVCESDDECENGWTDRSVGANEARGREDVLKKMLPINNSAVETDFVNGRRFICVNPKGIVAIVGAFARF